MRRRRVVSIRLPVEDLEGVEAVMELQSVDRTTLLREFIREGLRRRVLRLYREGVVTAARAAEILGVSLREFLEMLEGEGIPVNWDQGAVREYLRERYGV